MVFAAWFGKDYRYYREKGEKLLGQERYAEARIALQESLEKVASAGNDAQGEREKIAVLLADACNGLARMNLAEAEFAVRQGALGKAREHIDLAMELAEDVLIREKAEKFLQNVGGEDREPQDATPVTNCSNCSAASKKNEQSEVVMSDALASEDRFELLVQTLPDGLRERYEIMGEKFACALTLAHEGELDAAREIYEELAAEAENDILLYELSVIDYRHNRPNECERRLRRAIALNDRNPLCYIALVHLLADTGRADEAVPLLQSLLERGIMVDQAIFLLGEIYLIIGDEGRATDCYGQALTIPHLAKAGAEKLVPLLEKQGRGEEAEYLFKKYLKGCC